MRADPEYLLQRDGQAFAAFYRHFEDSVLAFFRARTSSPEESVDLAAETFVRALEGRERFDPDKGRAAGWLFGIATNVLQESRRAGRVEDRTRRRLQLEPLVVDDTSLARVEELNDRRATQALAQLEQPFRDAILGRIVQEHSYPALAAALECSESLVRQRVSRGLRRLRTELKGTP